MKRNLYVWFIVAATLVFCAVILSRKLAGAPSRRPAHHSEESTTSSQETHGNGLPVVRISSKTQARLGIRESPLKAARERKQVTLPAVVLPVDKLATLVSAYEAAAANLQKAEITAKVTQQEYQRLERLFRDQQNVSQKAVQSAEAVYRGDKVDVQLAREKVSLAAEAVLQGWGPVITGWMGHDTDRMQRVLRHQDVLVEMTLPSGQPFKAPSGIEFKLPAGGRAYARFVSAFPQVDPRVQGVGYLYVTRTRPGLAPGLDLVGRFGVGSLASGVIVPSSAVVWLHGKAWTYVAVSQSRFVRRQVSTEIPVPGGWFVTHGFQPGSSVVTQDAQQILGVELMPKASSTGGKKGDDD